MALPGTTRSSRAQTDGEAEKKIRASLYAWFADHGRALPWRQSFSAYEVLVSEFMLQQTTVAAVIPYFERWMKRFPTVGVLAKAAEPEVLDLWQGLGYYSRARNLHAAAKAVMEKHSGNVPVDPEELSKLPGIGPYTSAAVAAFSGDLVVPVLDANIIRVVARLNDYREPVDTARGKAFLDSAARLLLPRAGGRRHTSALMDLGAMICTARAPQCLVCPVRVSCRAEFPEKIPVKKPRPEITLVSDARNLIVHSGRLWLQLSSGPRWKGLWLLPEWSGPGREPDIVEIYPITRYRVTMNVFLTRGKPASNLEGFSFDNLPPMPSPHRRAVEKLLEKRAYSSSS